MKGSVVTMKKNIDMKTVFKKAHRGARQMVKKYGVDYRTQFAINVKFIVGQIKTMIMIVEYHEIMKEKVDTMRTFCENRYWSDTEEKDLCKGCKYRLACKGMVEVDNCDFICDYSTLTLNSREIFKMIEKHKDILDKAIVFYYECIKNDISKQFTGNYAIEKYEGFIRWGFIW